MIWRERTVRGEHQYQITFPSEPHVRRQYYRADQLTEVRLAPSAAGKQILSVVQSHTPEMQAALSDWLSNGRQPLTAGKGVFGVRPRFLDPPMAGDVDLSKLTDAEAKALYHAPRTHDPWSGAKVVVYFCSGELGKSDGIDTLLRAEGEVCIMLENDPRKGGNAELSPMHDDTYRRLMQRAHADGIIANITSLPCVTTTHARHKKGGAPKLLSLIHI